ncbi:MAG: PDZ domain-containing protein, partial [Planctomycetota bacterium]
MRSLMLGLGWAGALALVGSTALAQEVDVDVDAGGTTVRVGPDRGAGNVEVRAPGVDVEVDVDGQGGARALGRIIRIGPDRADERVEGEAVPAEPTYWVGILGGDISPELRSHLDLEEGGVIVREVVPGSPAAEGGLKEHDIVRRANGKPIAAMSELVALVAEVGPTKGRITLELIREGRPQTVWIAPAERPAAAAAPPLGQPGFREPANAEGLLGGLFGGDGDPFQFRMFGPGIMANGPNVQVQANGVSVSVSTVNGKTRVRAQRGDEAWDIDATDPAALDELPEEVRAIVDGVMTGGADVDINIDRVIPKLDGFFRDRFPARGALEARIERMQRQIDRLMKLRMHEAARAAGQGPAAGGAAAGGEAPGFQPNDV